MYSLLCHLLSQVPSDTASAISRQLCVIENTVAFSKMFFCKLKSSKQIAASSSSSPLKGYATPKSRLCFCLHFRPKDDVVVSILLQGKHSLNQKCLVVCPFRRVNAPLFIKRVISLVPESKQQQNTDLCLCELKFYPIFGWVNGHIWINKLRWEGFKSSKKTDRAKNHW